MLCPNCKIEYSEKEMKHIAIVFKNGTKHTDGRCPKDGRHLKYISKEEPKIYFGKYKGRTIQEIVNEDRDYITWLYEQDWLKQNLKSKLLFYLEKNDTH